MKTVFFVNENNNEALIANMVQLFLSNDDYYFLNENNKNNSILDIISLNKYKLIYFLGIHPDKTTLQQLFSQYQNIGIVIIDNVDYSYYQNLNGNLTILNTSFNIGLNDKFIYHKLYNLLKDSYLGNIIDSRAISSYNNLVGLLDMYSIYVNNIHNQIPNQNEQIRLSYLMIEKLLFITLNKSKNKETIKLILNKILSPDIVNNIYFNLDLNTIDEEVKNILSKVKTKNYQIIIDNPLDTSEVITKNIYVKFINVNSTKLNMFHNLNLIYKNITNYDDTFICFFNSDDELKWELNFIPLSSTISPINYSNEFEVFTKIGETKINLIKKLILNKLPNKNIKINLNGVVSVIEKLTTDEFKILYF